MCVCVCVCAIRFNDEHTYTECHQGMASLCVSCSFSVDSAKGECQAGVCVGLSRGGTEEPHITCL